MEGGGSTPPSWTITRPIGDEWWGWCYQNWGYQGEPDYRYHIGSTDAAGAPFDITIAQNVKELESGVYRMEMYVYIPASQATFTEAYIFARGFGDDEKRVNVLPAADSWVKIVIDNIYVSNGTCEVGARGVSEGGGASSMSVDEFKLCKLTYE
jgi:hypothetical protein